MRAVKAVKKGARRVSRKLCPGLGPKLFVREMRHFHFQRRAWGQGPHEVVQRQAAFTGRLLRASQANPSSAGADKGASHSCAK
jgi:hypothetical protein